MFREDGRVVRVPTRSSRSVVRLFRAFEWALGGGRQKRPATASRALELGSPNTNLRDCHLVAVSRRRSQPRNLDDNPGGVRARLVGRVTRTKAGGPAHLSGIGRVLSIDAHNRELFALKVCAYLGAYRLSIRYHFLPVFFVFHGFFRPQIANGIEQEGLAVLGLNSEFFGALGNFAVFRLFSCAGRIQQRSFVGLGFQLREYPIGSLGACSRGLSRLRL